MCVKISHVTILNFYSIALFQSSLGSSVVGERQRKKKSADEYNKLLWARPARDICHFHPNPMARTETCGLTFLKEGWDMKVSVPAQETLLLKRNRKWIFFFFLLGSYFPVQDRTWATAVTALSPNHWTTREIPRKCILTIT